MSERMFINETYCTNSKCMFRKLTLEKEEKYCPRCGSQTEFDRGVQCQCGKKYPSGQDGFCSNCGRPLSEATHVPPPKGFWIRLFHR